MKQAGNITTGIGQDPDWESPEAYDQQTPYSTGEEATSAVRDLGFSDTAVGIWARGSALSELNASGAQKLTPEEANARFPGMQTPFKEPVNPYIAQMLSDREQTQQELTRKIQNGPQDPWQKTKNFGVGLLTHMMDPLEFGAGFVIGWGVGGAMVKTAYGARTALLAEGGSQSARLTLSAIEAASGNAIQNTAQELSNMGVSHAEGIKYDPVEGMKNAAISTLIGTGIGIGLKEGSFRALRFLKNTSPEADLAVTRVLKGQYEADIKPDARPILEGLAKETDVRSQDFPGKFEYQYEPATAENIKGRKFYISTDALDTFNPDRTRMIGEQHGLGVQASDNPGVANAAAARAMADSPGSVWEMDASDVRPLDLNSPLPPELHQEFIKASGGAVTDLEKVIGDTPGKQVMEALFNAVDEGDLNPKAIGELQDALKAKGYNAFIQDGTNVAGVDHAPHNLLTIFDGEHVGVGEGFRADPQVRNDPTPIKLSEALDSRNVPENKLYVDPEQLRSAHDLVSQADNEGLKLEDIEDKEFFDQFKSMEEQGLLDPSLKAEIERIQGLDQEAAKNDKIMKAVIGCVYG